MICTSDSKETRAFILWFYAQFAAADQLRFFLTVSPSLAPGQNRLAERNCPRNPAAARETVASSPASAHMLEAIGQPSLGSQTGPSGEIVFQLQLHHWQYISSLSCGTVHLCVLQRIGQGGLNSSLNTRHTSHPSSL